MPDPSPVDDALPPVDITVVIGSYNRAPMLAQTLASLTEPDTRLESGERFTYEIVAIDNASTDDTPQTIAAFAAPKGRGAAQQVRGYLEPRAGVTFARNRGIAEARGAWIAFHDDDQVAHPRWLAELMALAQRRDLKIVGGAVHLRLPESNSRELAPECRVLLGEKVGWDQEQPYTRKRVPGTNNLMLHRSVLDAVGVFEEKLTNGGEDADLYRRIRTAGFEAWYTPKSIVYHLIPEPRLGDDYMRWTATRHGQHLALRELRDWGRAGLAGMVVLRGAQAVIRYLPRFVVSKVAGDRERALGARALLWRSQAYLASAASMVLYGERDSASHDTSLNLREGRERLVRGVSSPSASR